MRYIPIGVLVRAQATCSYLEYDETANDERLAAQLAAALLNVFYNHTGAIHCLGADASDDGFGYWPFQA